jgi:hypothetical protein
MEIHHLKFIVLLALGLISVVILITTIRLKFLSHSTIDEKQIYFRCIYRLYTYVGSILGMLIVYLMGSLVTYYVGFNVNDVDKNIEPFLLFIFFMAIFLGCLSGHYIAVEIFVKRASPEIGSVGARQISRKTT